MLYRQGVMTGFMTLAPWSMQASVVVEVAGRAALETMRVIETSGPLVLVWSSSDHPVVLVRQARTILVSASSCTSTRDLPAHCSALVIGSLFLFRRVPSWCAATVGQGSQADMFKMAFSG
jgi:hypothetical protein